MVYVLSMNSLFFLPYATICYQMVCTYIHQDTYTFFFIQSHLEHKKHQTKCLISWYFTNLFVTLCQVTVLFLFVFVSVFLFSSMDTNSFIQLFNKFWKKITRKINYCKFGQVSFHLSSIPSHLFEDIPICRTFSFLELVSTIICLHFKTLFNSKFM